MDSKNCMVAKDCNGDNIAVISVFAHEMAMTRMERVNKRLTIACIVQALIFIIYIAVQ